MSEPTFTEKITTIETALNGKTYQGKDEQMARDIVDNYYWAFHTINDEGCSLHKLENALAWRDEWRDHPMVTRIYTLAKEYENGNP